MAEVYVVLRGWPAGGACKPLQQTQHARRAENALLPQPLPASRIHLCRLFLTSICVYECESERREGVWNCSAIRNLQGNYQVEGGEPVASGLGQTVRFATLIGGAR
jgi:hypothetical protein